MNAETLPETEGNALSAESLVQSVFLQEYDRCVVGKIIRHKYNKYFAKAISLELNFQSQTLAFLSGFEILTSDWVFSRVVKSEDF